jgi:alanine racemase
MAYKKLSKKNLLHNLTIVAKRAGGVQRVAAVLKDDAYGHGLLPIAGWLAEAGVNRAVVRTKSEAKKIENLFDYILVLQDTPTQKDRFVYAINSLEAIVKYPKGQRVELKVDTGMHRNGIDPKDLEIAFSKVAERKLELIGVFTHFRSADELGSDLFWQVKRFEEVKKRSDELAKRFGYSLHFHSANSAALMRWGIEDDFARVGIALYGLLEMDRVFELPPLQPVMSLWAKRLSVRKLVKGQRVGYGGEFEAPRDMVISTYDVGYGDGLSRRASGFTLPNGSKILGRVSMDCISVDSEEEEICIFEDARELASYLGTIGYEVVTSIKAKKL